jgi:hypothetical protein
VKNGEKQRTWRVDEQKSDENWTLTKEQWGFIADLSSQDKDST